MNNRKSFKVKYELTFKQLSSPDEDEKNSPFTLTLFTKGAREKEFHF